MEILEREENYFIYVHSLVNELFMYSSHHTSSCSTHLFFPPLEKCYKIDVRFNLFILLQNGRGASTKKIHMLGDETPSRKI